MKNFRAMLCCLGLLMLGGLGCATTKDIAELRAENAALRDSLGTLWRATEVVVRALVVLDTVPPPRCPPRCISDIVRGFPAAPR